MHDAVKWKNTYCIHFKCLLGFLLPKARYVWSKLTFDTSIHQIYLLRRYHRDGFVASLKFLYKNIQMLLIFPIKLKVKVNIKELVPRTFIQKTSLSFKIHSYTIFISFRQMSGQLLTMGCIRRVYIFRLILKIYIYTSRCDKVQVN